MTERMTSAEYRKLLAQQGTRSERPKRLPAPAATDRMTPAELRAHQEATQSEDELEAFCAAYLCAFGWMTTHHEAFDQAGPPLLMSRAQADQLRAGGARVMVYGKHVPTYLPTRPVEDQDRAWPDRICVHPKVGRAILIEFKKKGKKPRPDQKAFLDANPDTAFWCDSFEAMKRELAVRGLPGGE